MQLRRYADPVCGVRPVDHVPPPMYIPDVADDAVSAVAAEHQVTGLQRAAGDGRAVDTCVSAAFGCTAPPFLLLRGARAVGCCPASRWNALSPSSTRRPPDLSGREGLLVAGSTGQPAARPALDAVALADRVMKSRDHQDSKYRAGVPNMLGSRSVPLAGVAAPFGVRGA